MPPLICRRARVLCTHPRTTTHHHTPLQLVSAKVPILKGPLKVAVPRSELVAALAADNAAAAAAIAATAAGGDAGSDSVTFTVKVDISLGVNDGAPAVAYLSRQVRVRVCLCVHASGSTQSVA
jgi:hypothetical protein